MRLLAINFSVRLKTFAILNYFSRRMHNTGEKRMSRLRGQRHIRESEI